MQKIPNEVRFLLEILKKPKLQRLTLVQQAARVPKKVATSKQDEGKPKTQAAAKVLNLWKGQTPRRGYHDSD
ncbi:hypothetical protein OWV82_022519 [Melia azedarach]|uniref:Uncharacterized protein n=1 Tax=Melia azedarach TaxID=155640 RepID=A0ACC1WVM4_MELAZ|nr:hypothetical protein OWV82_022519 [Melia azedarach]